MRLEDKLVLAHAAIPESDINHTVYGIFKSLMMEGSFSPVTFRNAQLRGAAEQQEPEISH